MTAAKGKLEFECDTTGREPLVINGFTNGVRQKKLGRSHTKAALEKETGHLVWTALGESKVVGKTRIGGKYDREHDSGTNPMLGCRTERGGKGQLW